MNRSARQSGFTLAEITLYIVVVGLLIAGALKGRELYNNTRLQSVFSQFKEYESAAKEFKQKYKAWPGDFKYATTSLVGCTANSTNIGDTMGWPFGNDCIDGNGDSSIVRFWSNNYIYDPTEENLLFFRHMALANLIAPSTFEAGSGRTTTTKLGGIIFARTLNAPGFSQPGLYLILGNAVEAQFSPILTPRQSTYLDNKYDDGKPASGKLKFRGAAGVDNDDGLGDYDADGNPDTDDCTAGQIFQSNDQVACMMGMAIDQ